MSKQTAQPDPINNQPTSARQILVLSTKANSLTTQAVKRLVGLGYGVTIAEVSVEMAAAGVDAEEAARRLVERNTFDLIVCPFLTTRLPADVYQNHLALIFHPGLPGDTGPSSIDYALIEGKRWWGGEVIAAAELMDQGDLCAWGSFEVPHGATKSGLYNGLMTKLALDLIVQAVTSAFDPTFVPTPYAQGPRPDPTATVRPLLTKAMRRDDFGWDQPAIEVLRRIRAGDGSPGQPTTLYGRPVRVFDTHGPVHWTAGNPGEVVATCHEAVLVRVGGDQAVWVGQVRADRPGAIKLPATLALGEWLPRLPILPDTRAPGEPGFGEVRYMEQDDIGYLWFTHYNGAMSTQAAARATDALRAAKERPTKVLVLLGNSTGINLCTIAAQATASDRGLEAYNNIRAINGIPREILTSRPDQLIVYAFTGSAAAGGVHLALGAPLVLAPNGPGLLSLSYIGQGLTGSEFHSLAAPRRVGRQKALKLLIPGDDVLNFTEARQLGLVDELGPGDLNRYFAWVTARAESLRGGHEREQLLRRQACWASYDLDAIEAAELEQMRRDMLDGRFDFPARCVAFATKATYPETPEQTEKRLGVYAEVISDLLVSPPN